MDMDPNTVVAKVDGREYTHGELTALFDSVSDPDNWRNPVDRHVGTDADLAGIDAAVEFFTATRPTFSYTRMGTIRVQALGYNAGPAA